MPVHDRAKMQYPCITLYVYHNIPSIAEWDPRCQEFHCCYGLELKLVHLMCKIWHLVRPILLTIMRKFSPNVVHSTDTADFISQNST